MDTLFSMLEEVKDKNNSCHCCHEPLFKEVIENGTRKIIGVEHNILVCARRMVVELNID